MPRAADFASFVVEIGGVPPHETRTVAATLANEVATRTKNRAH
jgi:hypothetical protein